MIGDLRRVLSNIRVEDGREAFSTLFVNPASAFVFVAANLLLHRAGSSFAALVNPWELTLGLWLAGWLAVRLALLGFVDGAVWVLGPRLPALPSRVGPKPIFQHTINALDCTYLAINSTIEYVFALQIGRLLWHSDLVALAPAALGVGNGPVALGLLFYVDDMLYAPLHRFMHHHKVYKWVHKHHHRNTFPSRGYVDAANEHPVEQIAALALHWTALHVVAKTSGLHVAAVGAHFGLKALGACFNHTGYDMRFILGGVFEYSVRAHEMHHRRPNTNFAQYVMFWDRLMGTFVDYQSGQPKEWVAGKELARPGAPDRLHAKVHAKLQENDAASKKARPSASPAKRRPLDAAGAAAVMLPSA